MDKYLKNLQHRSFFVFTGHYEKCKSSTTEAGLKRQKELIDSWLCETSCSKQKKKKKHAVPTADSDVEQDSDDVMDISSDDGGDGEK